MNFKQRAEEIDQKFKKSKFGVTYQELVESALRSAYQEGFNDGKNCIDKPNRQDTIKV